MEISFFLDIPSGSFMMPDRGSLVPKLVFPPGIAGGDVIDFGNVMSPCDCSHLLGCRGCLEIREERVGQPGKASAC